MRKLKVRTLAGPVFVFAICGPFQTCETDLPPNLALREPASLMGSATDLTGVFAMKIYASGTLSPLSATTPLETGTPYTLRATGSLASTADLEWTYNSASTAACSLSQADKGNAHSVKQHLLCTGPGLAIVALKAKWPDATISEVSLKRTVASVEKTPSTASTPALGETEVVSFRIKPGTGGSPWNSAAHPLQVTVGQTLKVYNDDDRPHSIHTAGAPFPHQEDEIPVHGSSTFIIRSRHSGTATDIYDHASATTATFFINAVEKPVARAKPSGPG